MLKVLLVLVLTKTTLLAMSRLHDQQLFRFLHLYNCTLKENHAGIAINY